MAAVGLNTYLLHAIDTLTVVTVVGAVGGHCDREVAQIVVDSSQAPS